MDRGCAQLALALKDCCEDVERVIDNAEFMCIIALMHMVTRI
jgi:hypothetical protein